jgi:hypothetical protein
MREVYEILKIQVFSIFLWILLKYHLQYTMLIHIPFYTTLRNPLVIIRKREECLSIQKNLGACSQITDDSSMKNKVYLFLALVLC